MGAITNPPTPSSLSTNGAAYQTNCLNKKQRLGLLIEAKIVLLNYKGGTSYIGNHKQLFIDALATFKGFTPDAWGATPGSAGVDFDPGMATVGQFVQQANYRDATNMPSTLAAQLVKLGEQPARPTADLQLQNALLDILLLAAWG
jgi:hypothetical protein